MPLPLLLWCHYSALFNPKQVGWKHQEAVAELEAARKEKAKAFYEAKKKQIAARAKVAA